MNPPSVAVVNEFAKAFAKKGKGQGLTREEILSWFRRYSSNVVDPTHVNAQAKPNKEELFHWCLERLHVEEQYRALLDLCSDPPKSVNALPEKSERRRLRRLLFSEGAPTGLTLRAAKLSSWRVKRLWFRTVGRLEKSPAAAITSARSMLESVCKLVLRGLGQDPNLSAGDLPRLVKQTREALGLGSGNVQLAAAVSTAVQGVAEISNRTGDRHGTEAERDTSLAEARAVVHFCFAVALYLLDVYRVSRRAGSRSAQESQ